MLIMPIPNMADAFACMGAIVGLVVDVRRVLCNLNLSGKCMLPAEHLTGCLCLMVTCSFADTIHVKVFSFVQAGVRNQYCMPANLKMQQ